MQLREFQYQYPKELIAQHPLPEREASRMMVIDREKQSWQHRMFRDLPAFLRAGDVLVINNSKVFPARLLGQTAAGHPVEILLTNRCQAPIGQFSERWQALAKPMKRMKPETILSFGTDLTAEVVCCNDGFLQIDLFGSDISKQIAQLGLPPLPPYIRRKTKEDYLPDDRERYQTIYATSVGSAAAPTAGLHFTESMLSQLSDKGIVVAPVTLHVSTDTFLPVRTANIQEHVMHGEKLEVSEAAATIINQAKKEKRRVIAVGTTSARVLESAWDGKKIAPGAKETRLFMVPGYQFNVVDALLTNFHQPESTLLMLVSAFAGRDFILEAYQEAIRQQYRLFSFGDCMLIA